MGSADVIPGVSGGTVALITGIYEDLIQAIRSIDSAMLKKLLTGDFKAALAHIHLRFLISLFIGDLILGFYGLTEMAFVYLGFLAGPLLGRFLLARRRSVPRLGAAVFIAATVHFAVSNIGAWLTLYPQTLQGQPEA